MRNGSPQIQNYICADSYVDAFQAFYERQSHILWIGTVQSWFIFVGSIYAGPLFDQGHLQPLVGTSSFMLVLWNVHD
jgi:hypothetical protein